MLLFSTILDTTPSMTKAAFIALIEEWNANQSHSENIIPNYRWNGQVESKYGNNRLSLQVIDHQDLGIVAARYEKHSDTGAVWDTDYVFNYHENKLAIHLSRSYKEIQVGVDREFSTPHFITHLIEHGYLKDDGVLPMNREPVPLTDERMQIMAKLVQNQAVCHFPVVFVSKTHDDANPIDVAKLAGKLKGIAHVLVQPTVEQALALRNICEAKEEFFGDVGIYLPNGGHQRLRYTANTGYDEKLYDDVHRIILRNANEHAAPAMYTWQGVRNEMTMRTMNRVVSDAQQAQAKAEQEQQSFIETFDSDTEKLKKRIDELTKENEAKEREIAILQSRAAAYDKRPVIHYGNEREFFTDEIKDILLSVLSSALNSLDKESRRYHIVADIIANNDYQHLSDSRRERLKNLLNGERHMSPRMRAGLEELGFEITSEGKHHKIKYYNDNRYWSPLAKSGSDAGSGGLNAASDIAKHMF